METVLEKIRIGRLSKGYSQSYMAHLLDISQKAYCDIERGNTKLSLERFIDICMILELKHEEIVKILTAPKSN